MATLIWYDGNRFPVTTKSDETSLARVQEKLGHTIHVCTDIEQAKTLLDKGGVDALVTTSGSREGQSPGLELHQYVDNNRIPTRRYVLSLQPVPPIDGYHICQQGMPKPVFFNRGYDLGDDFKSKVIPHLLAALAQDARVTPRKPAAPGGKSTPAVPKP